MSATFNVYDLIPFDIGDEEPTHGRVLCKKEGMTRTRPWSLEKLLGARKERHKRN